MAGDNDLSDAGIRDIAELCKVGASADVYVGVEIDTRGEHTGSIRYEITEPEEEGIAYRNVIERLPEADTGKPESLLKFLTWGTDRYPADQRVVVIGGHGDGFRSRRRAIAIDEFGGALDMPEVEYVFERVGFHKKKIAILGFDACLMGMLEIANHFSKFADYLVASQQIEPGEGWPYDKVLEHLKHEPKVCDVASDIVDSYVNHYVLHGMTNVTQSAIRLTRTGEAMKSLSLLGKAVASHLDSQDASTKRESIRTIDMARASSQSFANAEYVDAVHFAENLSKAIECKVVGKYSRRLIESLNKAVIKNRVLRRSRKLANANGLSIWFPSTLFSFTVNRARYLELNGVEDQPGWLNFMDDVFAEMRYS
ncbi:clostripain-related cysteine peptidase [Rubripirellula lacrimiformis]|nr:clostripain-related cysteine peptidase [Rubripirellula lacrimiformis]